MSDDGEKFAHNTKAENGKVKAENGSVVYFRRFAVFIEATSIASISEQSAISECASFVSRISLSHNNLNQ
jgi:hypothetical protein